MGRIRLSRTVNAPPGTVYNVARNLDHYPSIMANLRQIDLLEKSADGGYIKARWHAEAKIVMTKRKMCWVQEDQWDACGMKCVSRVDPCEPGRFRHMNALWHFRPHPSGTVMHFDMDFQLSHPMATPAVHKIIDGIMERNNAAMLDGIKRIAEKKS